MTRSIVLLVLIFAYSVSFGQKTWSSDVAQIVYDNCSSCHNPSGIGPFSLMQYADASLRANAIKTSITNKSMPPWIADNDYQEYAHARVLTEAEIATITEWVDNGSPEGDASKTPPPPVYKTRGFIEQKPDLELKIPKYKSKATTISDDYVCFSLPSNLASNKKIRAFEVVPGNHSIVHHVLVYLDPTGNYATDTAAGVCTGPTKGLIGGYVPGSPPTIFPTNGTDFNLGFEIESGSNVVLAMHYPEGSFGELDSTLIRFWFYDDDVTMRELESSSLIENWQFALPANQETKVEADQVITGGDLSILTVFPHMHLLGKTIESYAVTPSDDTIPFVNIPHWDFEWQEFLFFKRAKKLPSGSTIYGKGVYDNTTNNHHNPNKPPKNVFPGLNTSDEMFLIYFHYLPYVAGDENRDIEALGTLAIANMFEADQAKVYPNPAQDRVMFDFGVDGSTTINLRIYDVLGQKVGEVVSDSDEIVWQIPLGLTSGIYHYSANIEGSFVNGSFVVR
ncbi:MAG: T9SS type A sorting domain-containing protein [Bacteroidia bacterium]|nr:T9SS type A sorting domain-containing protein [Bacteroidia bacterium]